MNQTFRETWVATVLLAAVVMLALTIVIVTVVDALALTATTALDAPAYLHYQRADEALTAGDVVLALRHWREGHAVAVASRRWEGLVEAGDLYRRIGGAGLAALSLWSLAFLFGVVTERMRAGCDRGAASPQRADAPGTDELTSLVREKENR